ncbi:MAG: M24 family metallopeptidase [Chlamydiota bacterium]
MARDHWDGFARRDFLRTLAGSVVLTAGTHLLGRTRVLKLSAAAPPLQHDRLEPDWYHRKIAQVQGELDKRGLDALLLLHAINVIYTTGYFHLSTERPLAAFIPKTGDPALFIPELEADQVKLWWIKDYETYFDYPGPVNRVRWIAERIARRGFERARIGIEEPTQGRLNQLCLGAPNASFVNADDIVEQMRWVKDDDELRIMRRAMYFADFTVQAGRDFIARRGAVTEDQILKASADAVADKMSRELHDVVGVGIDPPFGGLVPFGKRSAFPHAVPSKDVLKRGDPLILSFGAQVGGYTVECERSFCVGKPSDHAKRMFDAMLASHDAAVAAMKEGAIAQDVDKLGLDQIRNAGFAAFIRHRCGHGIGLQAHESPWIAEGDTTVLTSGMTFSCEPGVYDPNFGGFRHSDTVVVAKTGGQILNKYPTRLQQMIIEI